MKQKFALWQNAEFFMLKQVVHIITIFPVLLCGWKTWWIILKEKHRPRVFGNIKGLRGRGSYRRLGKITWWGASSFRLITNMFGWSRQGGQDGQGMWHTWGKKRNAYRVLVRKPEGKWLLGRSKGIDGRKRLWWTLEEQEWRAWTGLIWLRLGTIGGLLWVLCWTFGSISCRKFLDHLMNC